METPSLVNDTAASKDGTYVPESYLPQFHQKSQRTHSRCHGGTVVSAAASVSMNSFE
jgi:hypothetical protein